MEAARSVYRNIFVEILLLVALVVQLSIGLFFVYRSWNKRAGFFQRVQAISGCYLVFFLIAHVGAVLNGRAELDLDTNFYFAVAGIHIGNLAYYFIPYYFLAVAAIFVHVACAANWMLQSRGATVANNLSIFIMIVGIGIAAFITLLLAGVFYPIEVPAEYGRMFG